MIHLDNSPITTVWLDLDDTIINFRANSLTALNQLYTLHRLNTLFPTPQLWIQTYQHHNHNLWQQYNLAQITSQHLRAQRFILPLTQAGMPPQQAKKLWPQLDKDYLDLLARQKKLIPGARKLLLWLNTQPLTIGILSNGFTQVQHRKIKSAGISHLIHTTVLSDQIGINKPDIRLFKHAMQQVNDTNPAHHLIIGDNPQTDILGALNAHWHAIHLDPAQTQPQINHNTHTSFKNLPLITRFLIKNTF